MNRAQHSSNNAVLGAPKGWQQDELSCDALPITRTDVDGKPAVVSFWRPSKAEVALIQAGGLIAVWAIGNTVPPMSVMVEPKS